MELINKIIENVKILSGFDNFDNKITWILTQYKF